jgi:hypothetical protein
MIVKNTYDWFMGTLTDVEFDQKMAELMGNPYPNPSADVISVPLTVDCNARLMLTDIFGREVLNSNVSSGTLEFRIDCKGLQAGTYLLKLTNDKGAIENIRIQVIK